MKITRTKKYKIQITFMVRKKVQDLELYQSLDNSKITKHNLKDIVIHIRQKDVRNQQIH